MYCHAASVWSTSTAVHGAAASSVHTHLALPCLCRSNRCPVRLLRRPKAAAPSLLLRCQRTNSARSLLPCGAEVCTGQHSLAERCNLPRWLPAGHLTSTSPAAATGNGQTATRWLDCLTPDPCVDIRGEPRAMMCSPVGELALWVSQTRHWVLVCCRTSHWRVLPLWQPRMVPVVRGTRLRYDTCRAGPCIHEAAGGTIGSVKRLASERVSLYLS